MSSRTPVRVSSLPNAPAHSGWSQQVISLLDPDIFRHRIPTAEQVGVTAAQHLVLFFDDVEDMVERPGIVPPTFEDWERIVSFADTRQNVLVHCHGGISRSSATAIGLMIARGFSPEDSARMILSQDVLDREGMTMFPNVLILEFIDAFFGLGNTLTTLTLREMRSQGSAQDEEFERLLARGGAPRGRFIPPPTVPHVPVILRCEPHEMHFDTRWGCPRCR